MFPQLSAAVRVFLCTKPTDMRKGFDGLFGMVQEFLGQDPLSGHLFLFLNRRRDRVKVLFWERGCRRHPSLDAVSALKLCYEAAGVNLAANSAFGAPARRGQASDSCDAHGAIASV